MMKSTLRKQIESLAAGYPRRSSALIPALWAVQAEHGYVPRDHVPELAELTGVTDAHVYGVLTYYTMFHDKPIGRYHLQVDTNIPATLMGAGAVLERIGRVLGIGEGETTPDGMFTLSCVEDLASCATCPVVQVNDRYYEAMTPEKVEKLIENLRKDILPDWPVETKCASECRILLRPRGDQPVGLAEYRRSGGYGALAKALSLPRADVQKMVKDSYLRGRGGAGFPTGVKWGFLPAGSEKPVYLICNADEGEPGTFKDRQIMEFDPHLLLEGMAISGYATGAELGFIYIRGEFGWIAQRLERAVVEARNEGVLGGNVLGKGVRFDVIVHRGAGAYVCGEETALIESLEGKRGNPRLKPPFPAVVGLYGCPTVVNNVETLACVPHIVAKGPEAFRAIGAPNSAGPKLFGVSGHVMKPGVFEYPLGVPLATVLEAAGGVRGVLKAVIVGGLSAPILTVDEARGLNLDYDSCVKHGTMLGSGGIVVVNDTVGMPALALRTIEFYAHESCGQCTPCREGSQVIAKLLKRLVEGRGEAGDVDRVLELCATIRGSTLCPTGDAFAMPVQAMVSKFRGEFDALVR